MIVAVPVIIVLVITVGEKALEVMVETMHDVCLRTTVHELKMVQVRAKNEHQ